MYSQRISPHLGHTLIEVIAAMVCSTILLAGLGSVMFIASQTAYTPAASSHRLEAAEAVNDLIEEARFATFIVDRSTDRFEFVVADRNNDGAAERIRYEWSGVPGEPLYKTLNGGTPVAVVESVQDFQCAVAVDSEVTTLSTTTDTAEAILLSNANSMTQFREVTSTNLSAQAIDPSSLAAAGRSYWNATRVEFQTSLSGSSTETLYVQLRSVGDPNSRPSSEVLGEVQVPESSLSSSIGWQSFSFPSPVRGLQFHRNYGLVLVGSSPSSSSARLRTNTNIVAPLQSDDSGATWAYTSSAQMNFRVWGTYTTPGTNASVTRNYGARVSVVLQAGQASHSRVEASTPLANRPELLSAYWRTDFDRNPLTLDVTRDGVADWVTSTNNPIDVNIEFNGTWGGSVALESRPRNDFTNVTILDARCRNTSVGGDGAVVQINVDRQGGTHAHLTVRLQRQSDSSQTLTLLGEASGGSTVTLFERKNLSSGLIRFRLLFLPANDLVNLTIEGEDQGTFSYSTSAPSGDDRFLKFYADTSNAEFDYVELRVAEN